MAHDYFRVDQRGLRGPAYSPDIATAEDIEAGGTGSSLIDQTALESRFRLDNLPMETSYVAIQHPVLTIDGANDLYVPLSLIFTPAPRLGYNTGVEPTNSESAEIQGYAKIAAPSAASMVYFDFAQERYEIATYPTAPSADSGFVPIASWWNGEWSPFPGVNIAIHEDARFFADSMFLRGNDPDNAQIFSGNTTIVDVTDPLLTGLGLARGWAGLDAWMGEELPDGLPIAGYCFGRIYIEASADNVWKSPQLYALDGSGATLGSFNLVLEEKLSDQVAIFSIETAYSFARPPKKFNIGTFQNATTPVVCCGGQVYFGARRARVAKGVWPRSRDLDPIYGPDMFLAYDRTLPLYAENLFADRGEPTPIVSVSATLANELVGYEQTQAGGMFQIDPDGVGTAVTITAVPDGERARVKAKSVVSKVLGGDLAGATARVLVIGDSISNRQTGYFADRVLDSLGANVTWIGTMNGANTTNATSTGGPLGEAREGWGTRDFLGTNLVDGDVPLGVLPIGDEADYLAGTKTAQLGYQPFLNPNISAGSAAPIVNISGTNYRFDMRFYLDRFDLDDPQIVAINLVMNDVFEDASVYPANISYIIAEVRRVLPTARILLWATAMPRGFAVETRDRDIWAPMRRVMVEKVEALRTGGDANVYLASIWAHMTPIGGWSLTTVSTDAAKVRNSLLSDDIHPTGIARQQHSEALAIAIANLI